MDATSRLPLLSRERLKSEEQKHLFDKIVSSRSQLLDHSELFAPVGDAEEREEGLRGPWNAQVTSPGIGKHLEQLADSIRKCNALEKRQTEVAILVVAAHWESDYEWNAHSQFAVKAGVDHSSLERIKRLCPPSDLENILKADELAIYKLALELVQTKHVSDKTYEETKGALSGCDRKMVDLCFSISCYMAISCILNMFDVK